MKYSVTTILLLLLLISGCKKDEQGSASWVDSFSESNTAEYVSYATVDYDADKSGEYSDAPLTSLSKVDPGLVEGASNSSPLRVTPPEMSISIPEWDREEITITLENTNSSTANWSLEFDQPVLEKNQIFARQSGTSDYDLLNEEISLRDSVHVIVKLKKQTMFEGVLDEPSREEQRQRVSNLQKQVISEIQNEMVSVWESRYTPLFTAKVDEQGLNELLEHPRVLWVKKDREDEPQLDVSTQLVGANEVWESGYTGKGQAIGILDAGVDRRHPHIADNIISEACFNTIDSSLGLSSLCGDGSEEQIDEEGAACNPSAGAFDLEPCRHGTSVAGIAAGQHNKSGVAPDAGIFAVAICSIRDNDRHSCRDSDQIKGKEYLYRKSEEEGYDIASINMSTGGGEYNDYCDDEDARTPILNQLASIGIPFISSSGNDGYTNSLSAPACVSTTISVGSVQSGKAGTRGSDEDRVAESSNSSNFLDILAPGVYVESPHPDGGYDGGGGTSRSAPHVAGAWALMKEKWPDASIEEIKARLTETGKPITDHRNNITKPRLQVDAAISEDLWLAATPKSGRLSGGESKEITLTFNATSKEPGNYEETITFREGNTQTEMELDIEITEQESAKVAETSSNIQQQGRANQPFSITEEITNDAEEGGQVLVIALDEIPGFLSFNQVTGEGVSFQGRRARIEPQATAEFEFDVMVDVQGPTVHSGVLELSSNDPDNSEMEIPMELDIRSPLVELESQSMIFNFSESENDQITKPLVIENTGNYELNGSLEITEGAEHFTLSEEAEDVNIEPGVKAEIDVQVNTEDQQLHTGKLELTHDAPNQGSPLEITIDVLPDEIALNQNYPNPFNDQTTIEFSIPEEANVLVEVFNAQGQKITSLVDGPREPGVYQVQWNGGSGSTQVASGTYIVRLIADGEIRTGNMTLLK